MTDKEIKNLIEAIYDSGYNKDWTNGYSYGCIDGYDKGWSDHAIEFY